MKSGYACEILHCPASQSTGFHFGKLPTVMGHTMNKIFFILLIHLFGCTISFAQSSLLLGKVLVDNEPAPFGLIYLTDDSSQTLYGTSTNYDGNFKIGGVLKGTYDLHAANFSSKDTIINDLIVEKDTLIINLELNSCNEHYFISNCPICLKNDMVIRVGSNGIIRNQEPWGNYSEKQRSSRKTRKLGYESYDYFGQELLYFILDEDGRRKYDDKKLCDEFLFCKRDKLVFKSYAP
jgi:hypothetical protein